MNEPALKTAKALWTEGDNDAAAQAAWRAYDDNPRGASERRLLARILRENPEAGDLGSAEALYALVTDPQIEPGEVSAAAWHGLRDVLADDDTEMLARTLEGNTLALTLLGEDIVAVHAVEAALSRVRRWLLEANRWSGFPRLAGALVAQAALNGGAWPFGDSERRLLETGGAFARAYLPEAETAASADYREPVTRAVAEQYEAWPYPFWTRTTRPAPKTLAATLRKLDPGGPDTISEQGADVLIAGCGTGRQIALHALAHPECRFVAIDISGASLRYAQRRCDEAGVSNVEYVTLDLHDAARLGRKFDAVFCAGVLHHLPDPEAGWAALADVLRPGGTMHVMVYSKLARMRVRAMRRILTDLLDKPVTADVLREVRRRVVAQLGPERAVSRDFFYLAGVHDLLMHRHEDPFDVPRIRRALDALGLRLLRFNIPVNAVAAEYRRTHPQDPLFRDFQGWMRLDLDRPTLYARMFDFWCRKP
jgi:SAM-dependent methyltransferase